MSIKSHVRPSIRKNNSDTRKSKVDNVSAEDRQYPKDCDVCGVAFASDKNFIEHSWSLTHHIKVDNARKGSPHACVICQKTYETLKEYGDHLTAPLHRDARAKLYRALGMGRTVKDLVKSRMLLIPQSQDDSKRGKTMPAKNHFANRQPFDKRNSRPQFYQDDAYQHNYSNQWQGYPRGGNAASFNRFGTYVQSNFTQYGYQWQYNNSWPGNCNRNWGNYNYPRAAHSNVPRMQGPQFYNDMPMRFPGCDFGEPAAIRNQRHFNDPNFMGTTNTNEIQHGTKFQDGDLSQNAASTKSFEKRSTCPVHGDGMRQNAVGPDDSKTSQFVTDSRTMLQQGVQGSVNADRVSVSAQPKELSYQSPKGQPCNSDIDNSLELGSPMQAHPKLKDVSNKREIVKEKISKLVNLSCSRKQKLQLQKLIREYTRTKTKADVNQLDKDMLPIVDASLATEVISSLTAAGLATSPMLTRERQFNSKDSQELLGQIMEFLTESHFDSVQLDDSDEKSPENNAVASKEEELDLIHEENCDRPAMADPSKLDTSHSFPISDRTRLISILKGKKCKEEDRPTSTAQWTENSSTTLLCSNELLSSRKEMLTNASVFPNDVGDKLERPSKHISKKTPTLILQTSNSPPISDRTRFISILKGKKCREEDSSTSTAQGTESSSNTLCSNEALSSRKEILTKSSVFANDVGDRVEKPSKRSPKKTLTALKSPKRNKKNKSLRLTQVMKLDGRGSVRHSSIPSVSEGPGPAQIMAAPVDVTSSVKQEPLSDVEVIDEEFEMGTTNFIKKEVFDEIIFEGERVLKMSEIIEVEPEQGPFKMGPSIVPLEQLQETKERPRSAPSSRSTTPLQPSRGMTESPFPAPVPDRIQVMSVSGLDQTSHDNQEVPPFPDPFMMAPSSFAVHALDLAIEEENIQSQIHVLLKQITKMQALLESLQERSKAVQHQRFLIMKQLTKSVEGRKQAANLNRIISEIPNDPSTELGPNIEPGSFCSSTPPIGGPLASGFSDLGAGHDLSEEACAKSIPGNGIPSPASLHGVSKQELPHDAEDMALRKKKKRKSDSQVEQESSLQMKKSKPDNVDKPEKLKKLKKKKKSSPKTDKNKGGSVTVLPSASVKEPLPDPKGPQKETLHFHGHVNRIVQISGSTRDIYTCSTDGTVRTFKVKGAQGKCVTTFTHQSENVIGMEVITSPKAEVSDCLITASSDGTIKKFDLRTGECLTSFKTEDKITCIAYRWACLFVGFCDGSLSRIAMKNLKVLGTFNCSNSSLTCMTTAVEGSYRIVCVGSEDKSVTIREAHSGLLIRHFQLNNEHPIKIAVVNGISFTLGFSEKKSNAVYMHNFSNGEMLCAVNAMAHITSMHVCDDQLLFLGGSDGLIRIMNPKTRELNQVYYGAGCRMITYVNCFKNMLISGNDEGKVEACKMLLRQVHYCKYGRCPGKFAYHEDLVFHVRHVHASSSPKHCQVNGCYHAFHGSHSSLESITQHIISHAKYDTQ